MKFSYREYVSIFPGTNDYRLILRPVITIRVVGPNADARWDALVDSGDRLKIHYGDVKLHIESGREVIAWKTTVGFVDFGSASDEVIILGHGGCLDFFTATFDGEKAELELKPNALLPS